MSQQAELKGAMPAFTGFDQMSGRHQDNIAAVSAACKTILDGTFAIADRQREAISEANRRYAVMMWRSAMPGSWDQQAASLFEFAKDALETSMAQLATVTEILSKMQTEALAILEKTAKAGADDLRRAATINGASAK